MPKRPFTDHDTNLKVRKYLWALINVAQVVRNAFSNKESLSPDKLPETKQRKRSIGKHNTF